MYKSILFPLLSHFEREAVHDRTIALLTFASRSPKARGLVGKYCVYDDPRLAVDLFGLRFRHPLGLAAGFDKNGAAFPILGSLGFSHVEVGTVTPFRQDGNPKPRVFSLLEDKAIINRMGFPGMGMRVAQKNLLEGKPSCILGLNVGANKDSVEAGRASSDYRAVIKNLGELADYITVNVSSPNTARLRDLQGKEALALLLDEVLQERNRACPGKPVFVKIAPDLPEKELDDISEVLTSRDIQGVIGTNTTISRPPTLRSRHKDQTGGLSGRPLATLSTEIIRYIYKHTEGRLPIIGVGGVFTTADVLDKMCAGASLVQSYTGFVYEGPLMPQKIQRGLSAFCDRQGLKSIQEIVGVYA